jgi:hypothetical protein
MEGQALVAQSMVGPAGKLELQKPKELDQHFVGTESVAVRPSEPACHPSSPSPSFDEQDRHGCLVGIWWPRQPRREALYSV